MQVFVPELTLWGIGLFILLVFNNALLSIIGGIWGLYWYGAYWSIFFTIFLARLFYFAQIHRGILVLCLGCMIWNQGNVFAETNRLYKEYHYYPCAPNELTQLFSGKIKRFDPSLVSQFSGEQLQDVLWKYWYLKKQKKIEFKEPVPIPKELMWSLIELNPGRYYFLHRFLKRDSEIIYYLIN